MEYEPAILRASRCWPGQGLLPLQWAAMNSTFAFDVCIRGAGIVGKTLALTLAREKLRVALVAAPPVAATQAGQAPARERDVRAYALNHASHQLLQSLRCWPAAAVTPVQGMRIWGDGAGMVAFAAEALADAAGTASQAHAPLNWIVDVPALEDVLDSAVHFQPSIEWVDAPVPAALTAICEGRQSATRTALGVEYETLAYAQHAVATRVRARVPHQGVARQWFQGDDILALLPLGGADGHEYAVVWSTTPEHARQLLLVEEDEFVTQLQAIVQHGHASEADEGNASEAAADELGFTLTASRHRWPLRLSRARHWTGAMPAAWAGAYTAGVAQNWVLLGDAAHTVHPLSGSGLNLGLGDVRELAQQIAQRPLWRSAGDRRLLRNYERARKSALVPFVLATDGLQQLFAHHEGVVHALRNWGMNQFDRSAGLKSWLVRQASGL